MTQTAWAVAACILPRPICFHFSHSTSAMHACSGAPLPESWADVAGHWGAPMEGTAA